MKTFEIRFEEVLGCPTKVHVLARDFEKAINEMKTKYPTYFKRIMNVRLLSDVETVVAI
jgi:hypothetical protein